MNVFSIYTSAMSQRTWVNLFVTGIMAGILPAPAPGQQRTLAPPEFQAWLPITDAERGLKSPAVEKDAGAEVLLWRVHVVDELLGDNQSLQRVFYHYIRLKVFDDKGKESASTIDLPYREPGGILDVSGKTVKADGSIVELDRKTVYKRDIERAGSLRQKAVSFAMPGVEPGAILEYRWKQIEDDNRFRYVRLHFQREFPVQKVTYYVKGLSSRYVVADELLLAPFNCRTSPVKQEIDGYASTTVENVPASHYEPFAPSEANVEQWALLFYRERAAKTPEKYWEEEGKQIYKELKDGLKSDDDLKASVAKVVAGAKDGNEKIAALLGYVRASLRDVFDPATSSADRQAYFEKVPKDRKRTSAEIFKSGLATPNEMNVAFAAAALQAGMDARPALLADRNEIAFNPKLAERYFLDNVAMAVKLGDSWKLFDVGSRHLFPGMLPWREEGMFALITDPKTPSFMQSAISAPDASIESRRAKLRLTEEGGLTGDVEEGFTGHRAEDVRLELVRQSAAQREEWAHNRVVHMFPDADVTAIKIENVDDPSKPVMVRYHLEAQRFAQVTGKRMLFQPVAFRRGQATPFSASERRYPVEFPYSWKELDSVQIQLPDGYSLDNPTVPSSLNLGSPGGYSIRMTFTNGSPAAVDVSREFTFGNNGMLIFPAGSYGALKKAFDEVQVRDRFALSLKAN